MPRKKKEPEPQLVITHEPRQRWTVSHGKVKASFGPEYLTLREDHDSWVLTPNQVSLKLTPGLVGVLEAVLVELKAELQAQTPA